MSEETPIVESPNLSEEPEPISEPITRKDPKRVEQGKKLAAISKQAKEEKMRRKIKEEDFSYLPWIGYAAAFVSSASLFYVLLTKKEDDNLRPVTITRKEPKTPPPPPKPKTPPAPKPPRKKFASFD